MIEELEKKKAKKTKVQKGGNQMTSEPTPAEATANPNDLAMVEEGDEDALLDEEKDPEMIQLTELLKEMNIDEKKDDFEPVGDMQDDDDDEEMKHYVKQLGAMNVKGKK